MIENLERALACCGFARESIEAFDRPEALWQLHLAEENVRAVLRKYRPGSYAAVAKPVEQPYLAGNLPD